MTDKVEEKPLTEEQIESFLEEISGYELVKSFYYEREDEHGEPLAKQELVGGWDNLRHYFGGDQCPDSHYGENTADCTYLEKVKADKRGEYLCYEHYFEGDKDLGDNPSFLIFKRK